MYELYIYNNVLISNQIKNKEQVEKDISEILGVSYEGMYKHISDLTDDEKFIKEIYNFYKKLESEKSLNMRFIFLNIK